MSVFINNVRNERRRFSIAIACALITAAILVLPIGSASAAGKPQTVAEIALYQGPDREQILIEGAKKEGQLTLYNTFTWMGTMAKEFEKKYPFIKVSVWRSVSADVLKRVVEEYSAGRFFTDVIDISAPSVLILNSKGLFQEYYTPEMDHYADEVKAKGKTGVYYLGHLEDYIGLGFNTERVTPAEAPKDLNDLLDPKWKGKMAIAGGATGPRWIGNAMDVMGNDYIEKLKHQDIKVHNIAASALAGLVTSGEVTLSPTIYLANVVTGKKKGAPLEWRPLEPVVATASYSGMVNKSPHPHAALLFLDYIHSREGQKMIMQGGLKSPRGDMSDSGQGFKKAYLESRYKTLDQYEKKYGEWQGLMRKLFIQGK